MAATFARLHIAGFKSFAEPASVLILPGLTGIVGPNGCGKSNVVEALRWLMGETSARALRGGEMDDVIFGGTAHRASRNIAEVTLTLEGAAGLAPAPHDADAELQVTRRLERGAGSSWRVNGREVRGRDVSTLFADLASGARSSGLISQGRVGALVGARPEERRQLLEEAAGITGLHARRHEAELKLRAAEANLGRAEDLAGQLGQQLDGLRGQAKQAARYRVLSASVREAEAGWLAVLHGRAAEAREAAAAAHGVALGEEQRRRAAAAGAAGRDAAAGAALPALREAEAGLRTALERRRVESERLAGEGAQAEAALAAAEERLAQTARDLGHARLAHGRAVEDVAALATEAARLERTAEALPGRMAAAEAEGAAAAGAVEAAGRAAEAAGRRAAEAEGALRGAEARLGDAQARAARAGEAHRQIVAEHAAASGGTVAPEVMAAAEAAAGAAGLGVRDAEAGLGVAAAMLAAAVEGAARARGDRDEAARARQAAEAALAAARREADRLGQRHAETLAAQAEARAERPGAGELEGARRREVAAAEAFGACAAALEVADGARVAAEAAFAEARRQEVAVAGERTRAAAAVAEAQVRLRRCTEGLAAAEAELAAAESARVPAADRDAARDGAEHADAADGHAARALAGADAARTAAEAALAAAVSRQAGLDAAVSQAAAEHRGLREALGPEAEAGGTLADVLDVPQGLELAVGAALGAGLEGADGAHPEAARHWRVLPPLGDAAAPAGTAVLAGLLSAPAELSRALSRVFLLDEGAEAGGGLQAALRPGEVVVSRDGAAWRWDGEVVRAGTPTAAAMRLRQRARLREAGLRLEAARAAAADHAGTPAQARHAAGRAAAAAADARTARRTAEEGRAAAARRVAALDARDAQARARCLVLAPQRDRLGVERREAEAALAAARAVLDALPDAAPAAGRDALGQAERGAVEARAARGEAEAALAEARGVLSRLELREVSAANRLLALAPQEERLAADVAESGAACRAAGEALDALPGLAGLEAALGAAENARAEAARGEAEAAGALREARAAEAEAVGRRDALAARHAAAAARLEALAPQIARLEAEAEGSGVALEAAGRALAALPDLEALRGEAGAAGQALAEAREAEAVARAVLRGLREERERVAARRAEIAGSRAEAGRLAAAEERAGELERRLIAESVARDALAAAPARAGGRAAQARAVLGEAEAAHAAAAAALAGAEEAARLAAAAHHAGQAGAAAAREAVLRAEGALAQAVAALDAVAGRVVERLGEGAELPPAAAGAGAAEEERARRRLDRLAAEREAMGPVNLRAEAEAEAAGARLDAIAREREEIVTAVARLRGAIGSLNREGRERLAAVFQQVDREFRQLFARLFGGGRAHLALVGSDDPLEAGLEIYAQPPGKTAATLSLLSGGEQALTALALIFATFRCQPAPVCVLDEVDAPLDDANVARFCALLADMAAETGTRFLVVTHHAVTMARMDRLYGVTMQERGVSRLLSVDLTQAAGMAAE
ncbi:MAG: AAA family ATPase [Janthinobacterium lividum]